MPVKFWDHLSVNDLQDLGIIDMIEIRNAYREQLLPFIREWRTVISDLYKKKSKDDE
jgi:hypothetical protein